MMAASLRVQVSEEGTDVQRVAALAGYLRAELLQLDVGGVTAIGGGEPPPGARASEISVIGGLLVTMGDAAGGLRSVVLTIRDWLRRGGGAGRAVVLELDGDKLELSQASAADQERLIELFVSRHSAGNSDQCQARAPR